MQEKPSQLLAKHRSLFFGSLLILAAFGVSLPVRASSACLDLYKSQAKHSRSLLRWTPFSSTIALMQELNNRPDGPIISAEATPMGPHSRSFLSKVRKSLGTKGRGELVTATTEAFPFLLSLANTDAFFCPDSTLFTTSALAKRFNGFVQGISPQLRLQAQRWKEALAAAESELTFSPAQDRRQSMTELEQAMEIYRTEATRLSQDESTLARARSLGGRAQRLGSSLAILIGEDPDARASYVGLAQQGKMLAEEDPLAHRRWILTLLLEKLTEVFIARVKDDLVYQGKSQVQAFATEVGLDREALASLYMRLVKVVANPDFLCRMTAWDTTLDETMSQDLILSGLERFLRAKPSSAELASFVTGVPHETRSILYSQAIGKADSLEDIQMITETYVTDSALSRAQKILLMRLSTSQAVAHKPGFDDLKPLLDQLVVLHSEEPNLDFLGGAWTQLMAALPDLETRLDLAQWIEEQAQPSQLVEVSTYKLEFLPAILASPGIRPEQIRAYGRGFPPLSHYYFDYTKVWEVIERALERSELISPAYFAALITIGQADSYQRELIEAKTRIVCRHFKAFLAGEPSPSQLDTVVSGLANRYNDTQPCRSDMLAYIDSIPLDRRAAYLVYPYEEIEFSRKMRTELRLRILQFISSAPKLDGLLALEKANARLLRTELQKLVKREIQCRKGDLDAAAMSCYQQRLQEAEEKDTEELKDSVGSAEVTAASGSSTVSGQSAVSEGSDVPEAPAGLDDLDPSKASATPELSNVPDGPANASIASLLPDAPAASTAFAASSPASTEAGEEADSLYFNCAACLEDCAHSENKGIRCRKRNCVSTLCTKCAFAEVSAQLQEGRGEPYCRLCQTPYELSQDELCFFGARPPTVRALMMKRVLASLEKRSGKLKACSTADCPYAAACDEADKDHVFACKVCGKEQCFTCGSNAHRGVSCKEYRSGDAHLQELIDRGIVQFCPGCNAPAVRIDACSSVTCRQCRRPWHYRGEFREINQGWK